MIAEWVHASCHAGLGAGPLVCGDRHVILGFADDVVLSFVDQCPARGIFQDWV